MSNKKFSKDIKDSSHHVEQRSKYKEEFEIKVKYNLSAKQKEFIDLAANRKTKIILCEGPAGVSKSYLSILSGLKSLLSGETREIIYSRPILESSDSGSKLGYLPGDRNQKIEPYTQVIGAKLDELLDKADSNKLLIDERVRFEQVNFVRGSSWNSSFLILDEAQNYTRAELVTFLTRLGNYCKAIVLADTAQSDLVNGKRGGFTDIFNKFNDEESKENGIYTFQFSSTDIVRSGLCRFIIEKLQKTTIEPLFPNTKV
jgi:phosphate starvation-inducible PhoH-like protein